MAEHNSPTAFTSPVVVWVDRDGASSMNVVGSSEPLSGSVGYAAEPSGADANVAGVAHDRHGSFDAVWWSIANASGTELRMVIGGNGRQEARSMLRMDDGWLVGGSDNGEPVIWIIPDR